MKILIELYDKEPIYNYLAAAVFRPDRVYFVGDPKSVNDKCRRQTENFARITGLESEFFYRAARSNNFDEIRREIKKILEAEHKSGNECVIDVTGGKDLALVASGTLMCENTEVICYDSEINSFRLLSSGETHAVDIGIPCEAFITAAGGTVYEKTRSMNFTADEWSVIRRIIRVYFDNCGIWTKFVKYLQRISKKDGEKIGDSLFIDAPLTVNEGGKKFECNSAIMQELEAAGAIKSVELSKNNIRFRYASSDLANLLANEGVWLELSVYLTAKGMPEIFDAQTGVKFVWDIPEKGRSIGSVLSDNVPRNEVDVVLSKGVVPYFISCKTRMPVNEDLNELYALKENFGGELAVAIMATTKYVDTDSPIHERAKAMGIGIIDERNFRNGTVAERLLRLGGKK